MPCRIGANPTRPSPSSATSSGCGPAMARHLRVWRRHSKARGCRGRRPPTLEAAAVAARREAIRLQPDDADAHSNLGLALAAQGKLDEAIAEYREAIRLQPDSAEAHYNLGIALAHQGKLDEAVAEYRTAIRLKPDYAEAHCNLGHLLRGQGDYAGALAMLRRGHELGTRQPGWRYPSAQWVADAERMAALAASAPGHAQGRGPPEGRRRAPGPRPDVLRHEALRRRRPVLGRGAGGRPEARRRPPGRHRYNAACAAALAGCRTGQGRPEARRRRAGQAARPGPRLAEGRAGRLGQAPRIRPAPGTTGVAQVLTHWKQDPDLAGIRDGAALMKLPAPEQKAFAQLWADVASLLKTAEAKPK